MAAITADMMPDRPGLSQYGHPTTELDEQQPQGYERSEAILPRRVSTSLQMTSGDRAPRNTAGRGTRERGLRSIVARLPAGRSSTPPIRTTASPLCHPHKQ